MNDDPQRGATEVKALPSMQKALGPALAVDPASLAAAADDFGHIVHLEPLAVLRPRSAEDVAAGVRAARRDGVKLAIRGAGHSMYGQTQVARGVVVDMSSLNEVREIGPDRVSVDAGARWGQVVRAALERGMTLPALTDYHELSVGGTLSVGGVTRMTHRYGFQVDTVLGLDVVTGEGELVTCSLASERELFEMALGGLGQCGIITRVTLPLIPAKQTARIARLFYRDLDEFLRDHRRVVAEDRADAQIAFVVPAPGGGWLYMMELAWFYTPLEGPDTSAALADLSYERGMEQIEEKTYADFVTGPTREMAAFKEKGLWALPHPWFDVFLPGSKASAFLKEMLSELSLAEIGPGFIAVGPIPTRRLTRPLARVPDEEVAFVLDVCRFAPSDPAEAAPLLERNRELFERCSAVGGTLYPVGAVPMDHASWRRQLAPVWDRLQRAKRRYDPDGILSPGIAIFGDANPA